MNNRSFEESALEFSKDTVLDTNAKLEDIKKEIRKIKMSDLLEIVFRNQEMVNIQKKTAEALRYLAVLENYKKENHIRIILNRNVFFRLQSFKKSK